MGQARCGSIRPGALDFIFDVNRYLWDPPNARGLLSSGASGESTLPASLIRWDRMRLISWNTARRGRVLDHQVSALADRAPDVVALQEVTPTTAPRLSAALGEVGLAYVASSSIDQDAEPKRRMGCLVASRFPLSPIEGRGLDLPWAEKGLSVVVASDWGELEVHTVHIPPGASNGWMKIEHFEAVYAALAHDCRLPRVLCGDFNSPQAELRDGRLVTWGQRMGKDGEPKMKRKRNGGSGEKWDAGERSVLEGLAQFDLGDVFRSIHGYDLDDFSFALTRNGKRFPRRFDHVFASRELNPVRCDYLHELRERGLSDHSPIEVEFGRGAKSTRT